MGQIPVKQFRGSEYATSTAHSRLTFLPLAKEWPGKMIFTMHTSYHFLYHKCVPRTTLIVYSTAQLGPTF